MEGKELYEKYKGWIYNYAGVRGVVCGYDSCPTGLLLIAVESGNPISKTDPGKDRWVVNTHVNNPEGYLIVSDEYNTYLTPPVENKPTITSKHYLIGVDVFPFDVLLSYGESNEELTATLVDLRVSGDKANEIAERTKVTGRAITYQHEEANWVLIRIKDGMGPCTLIGTVAHECMHAAHFILDECGMKYKFGASDEAYAHLTGYLTEQVIEGLEKMGVLNVSTTTLNAE